MIPFEEKNYAVSNPRLMGLSSVTMFTSWLLKIPERIGKVYAPFPTKCIQVNLKITDLPLNLGG